MSNGETPPYFMVKRDPFVFYPPGRKKYNAYIYINPLSMLDARHS
jgi:hypothetical protein